jgi:hypothetical protein
MYNAGILSLQLCADLHEEIATFAHARDNDLMYRFTMPRAFIAVSIVLLGACESLLGADFDRAPRGQDASTMDDSSASLVDAGVDGSDGAVSTCDRVDLQTSSEHCGKCAHSCLAGTCRDGTCKPVTIAQDRFRPSDLGLSGAYIYLVEQGTGVSDGRISRVPWNNCAKGPCSEPEILVPSLNAPGGLAVSRTDVFVTRGTATGQILRYAIDGLSPVRTFVANESNPTRAVYVPVLGQERLIWIQSNAPSGSVRAKDVSSDAGSASTLLPNRFNPADIAVRGTNPLCWTESGDTFVDTDGRVYCSDITGQNVKETATGQAFPKGLSIDGSFVYWVNRGNGTLQRRKLDLSSPVEELVTGLDNPASIAVDSDRIVWVENGTEPDYQNGRIVTSDKNGKNIRILAQAEIFPTRLLLDSTAAYYLVRGTLAKSHKDGALRRVAF